MVKFNKSFSVCMHTFLLGKYFEVEFLGHRVTVTFSFCR